MRLRELRSHFRIVPGPATTIRRSAAWRLSMQAHRSEPASRLDKRKSFDATSSCGTGISFEPGSEQGDGDRA
jgi:hypothetical protein